MSAIQEEKVRYQGLLTTAYKLFLQAAVATDTGSEETRCARALQYAEEAVAHLKVAVAARDTFVNGGALHQAIQAHDAAVSA